VTALKRQKRGKSRVGRGDTVERMFLDKRQRVNLKEDLWKARGLHPHCFVWRAVFLALLASDAESLRNEQSNEDEERDSSKIHFLFPPLPLAWIFWCVVLSDLPLVVLLLLSFSIPLFACGSVTFLFTSLVRTREAFSSILSLLRNN
jgi:hypothetical protein